MSSRSGCTTAKVLVIGGSGFTGQRLLAQLPPDWRSHALARSTRAAATVSALGAVSVRGDLADAASLRSALETTAPDLVVCVARLGSGHIRHLVAALEHSGGPRTILTTTAELSGTRDSTPVRIGREAEAEIEASGLPCTIIRPAMIYGRPGDGNMERLLGWMHRHRVVPVPDRGRAILQPVHVDDLADTLVRAALRDDAIGHTITVPGPNPLPLRLAVELAGMAVDRRALVAPVPKRVLRAAVDLQEKLLHQPHVTWDQIERHVGSTTFDVDGAVKLIDHRPRTFAEGIHQEAGLLGFRG